jgi:hypothetical protein
MPSVPCCYNWPCTPASNTSNGQPLLLLAPSAATPLTISCMLRPVAARPLLRHKTPAGVVVHAMPRALQHQLQLQLDRSSRAVQPPRQQARRPCCPAPRGICAAPSSWSVQSHVAAAGTASHPPRQHARCGRPAACAAAVRGRWARAAAVPPPPSVNGGGGHVPPAAACCCCPQLQRSCRAGSAQRASNCTTLRVRFLYRMR